MNANMNHILKILYFLTLSAAISGKASRGRNTVEDDYQRYAYNNIQAIDTSPNADKEQFGYREDQLNGAYTPLLEPHGNLKVVEYSSDDFSNGFNAIVQKLAASLTEPSPLFGPLPLPLPPVNPLINPLNYGFGTTATPVEQHVTVTGRSIPWDSKTHSFGGWVPLKGPIRKAPQAKIITRKYVNGQLYRVKSRPISLVGKTIIIKRKPDLD
ncbi:uncharacterized protein LOC112047154 [Bicyclus anynana]|uniref:Uncharacterized protein LOC112047154 n=1 Tax=Bicyclus anynana TaxID=110368 RepID=A0A6J1MWB3_BICAN|nr:uncharacterized protein LOC112047154 [Bicyclus anynana]